mgnify:FL=1
MEDWLKCQITTLVKYRQNQILHDALNIDTETNYIGAVYTNTLRILVSSQVQSEIDHYTDIC